MAGSKKLFDRKKGKDALSEHGMDVVGGIATIVDTALDTGIASAVVDGLSLVKDGLADGVEIVNGIPIKANPLFEDHGIDGTSEYSKKYLRDRKLKNIGGAVFQGAGTLASGVTQVNVAGVLRHGSADVSTSIHLCKLYGISKTFKQSDWLSKHCAVLIKMKFIKLGIRSGELAGDVAPNAIASAVLGISGTVARKVAAHQTRMMTATTAVGLHWRAYQEQKLAGVFGGTGPASRMLEEILTRRVHVLLGGQYDWKQVVREPAGWLVVQDKLRLI